MRIFVTRLGVQAVDVTTWGDKDQVYVGARFTIEGLGPQGQHLSWEQVTRPLPDLGSYVERDVTHRVVESTHDEWVVAA